MRQKVTFKINPVTSSLLQINSQYNCWCFETLERNFTIH